MSGDVQPETELEGGRPEIKSSSSRFRQEAVLGNSTTATTGNGYWKPATVCMETLDKVLRKGWQSGLMAHISFQFEVLYGVNI